jgi:anaerobic dimethyl sulfoxide reductase subunit C (anchor subunit)
MLKEWPLVAFTIAGQAAVGIFLVACFPWPLPFPMILVLGLLLAAVLLSFFHLHHPIRARRSLANLGTSWLSREIVFELGFMALVALELALIGTGAADSLLVAVHVAAGIAGVLFLFSMIKLYMLETLPFWNQVHTPLSFVSSALSLGALTAAAAFGRTGFSLFAVLFILADLAGAHLFTPGLGRLAHRARPSLRPSPAPPRHLALTGVGLEWLGFFGLVGAFLRTPGNIDPGSVLWAGVLALVLAGQVIRRFLFYGLLVRPGR